MTLLMNNLNFFEENTVPEYYHSNDHIVKCKHEDKVNEIIYYFELKYLHKAANFILFTHRYPLFSFISFEIVVGLNH